MKESAPHATFTHCRLHRYDLGVKTLPYVLHGTFKDVVKLIIHGHGSTTSSRLFKELCQEMEAEFRAQLFYTEVGWLSRGMAIARVLHIKEEVHAFLKIGRRKKEMGLCEQISGRDFVQRMTYLTDSAPDRCCTCDVIL